MLVLTLKAGQEMFIGAARVIIDSIGYTNTRLVVDAPRSTPVWRRQRESRMEDQALTVWGWLPLGAGRERSVTVPCHPVAYRKGEMT